MREFEARKPAAVILAAGSSSRMGQTKPTVLLEGLPMLLHAAKTFVDAGIDHIVVVTGFDAEKVAELAREHGLHPVYNDRFGEGMFSSVLTGIGAVPPEFDAALVLPVDIPFVSPTTVSTILGAMGARPIVVPRHRGRPGHPPLYTARCSTAWGGGTARMGLGGS